MNDYPITRDALEYRSHLLCNAAAWNVLFGGNDF